MSAGEPFDFCFWAAPKALEFFADVTSHKLLRFTTGTGEDLSNKDVLVQNFYDDECQNPVSPFMTAALDINCVPAELPSYRSSHCLPSLTPKVLEQIVLCVDTELRNERLDVTAYVTRQLKLKDTTLATDFRPVECEVRGVELEKLGGMPKAPVCSSDPAYSR